MADEERAVLRLSALDQSPVREGRTLVTITHDPKARLRSYELLAEAFGLPGGRP